MKAVSVIIPTYHEEKQIQDCIKHVQKIAQNDGVQVQILVIDASKTNETRKLAKKCTPLVYKAKKAGRGYQLSEGVAYAAHEAILFLHADSRLSNGALQEMVEILQGDSVAGGCFRSRMEERTILYRMGELFQHMRVQVFRTMYGDQGMFTTKKMLARVGGIPKQIIMEDVELSYRLRKRGKLVYAKTPIQISIRRYKREGLFGYVYRDMTTLLMYKLGYDLDRVAKYYRVQSTSL